MLANSRTVTIRMLCHCADPSQWDLSIHATQARRPTLGRPGALTRFPKAVAGSGTARRLELSRLRPGSFWAADRAKRTLAWFAGQSATTHFRTFGVAALHSNFRHSFISQSAASIVANSRPFRSQARSTPRGRGFEAVAHGAGNLRVLSPGRTDEPSKWRCGVIVAPSSKDSAAVVHRCTKLDVVTVRRASDEAAMFLPRRRGQV